LSAPGTTAREATLQVMEPNAEEPAPPAGDGPDLSRLEQIEAELHAVERALEQIDRGVYDGFAGLDALASSATDSLTVPAPPAAPSEP
jgi:hypothetical protein